MRDGWLGALGMGVGARRAMAAAVGLAFVGLAAPASAVCLRNETPVQVRLVAEHRAFGLVAVARQDVPVGPGQSTCVDILGVHSARIYANSQVSTPDGKLFYDVRGPSDQDFPLVTNLTNLRVRATIVQQAKERGPGLPWGEVGIIEFSYCKDC